MKRLIALFLSITTLCMLLFPTSTFALNLSEEYQEEKRDLITIVEEIRSLPSACSSENNSTIEILEDSDEFQIVKFTEDDKVDILTYNVATGQIYIDGMEITMYDVPNPNDGISTPALMSSFDHQHKCVKLQQKIIQFTSDALGAIIGYQLAVPTPTAIYIASEYINNALASGYGHSDACYAFMFKAMDDSYLFYVKYWSMYWDSGYYYHLKTYTQTIYN